MHHPESVMNVRLLSEQWGHSTWSHQRCLQSGRWVSSPGHGIRTQIVPLDWRVPHEIITEIMQKHQNNPRKISGVWSRSTREFLPIKVFAISPGKYPRKMATSRAKTVRIHHRSRPCRLRSAQGPLPGPWWGPQNPDHHSQKNGDWPWTLRNAQLTIKIIKGWDKKPLKKTYKILGRKHQKARIPWKSWDSVSKIYVPTTKFPTPHHLVLKTIATSPTHCTKPQAKPSVQSSMPQLMRMKPSVMPTWPPFSMYVQVRHWLRTIRNNQTRLYTFYDIIHVYST